MLKPIGLSTYKALHVYYTIFLLLSTTCAHACVYLFASTLSGLLLRREIWESSWRFRRVLGERAFSRLPVETSVLFPLLVLAYLFSLWDFRSCNNYNTLFMFWHYLLVYTESLHVCKLWSWRTCNICIWFCLWNRVWPSLCLTFLQRSVRSSGAVDWFPIQMQRL